LITIGTIKIKELGYQESQKLVEMLGNDNVLRIELGFSDANVPSAADFFHKTKEWCRKCNAITYSILLDSHTAIGTISLSHIDNKQKTARIGYWIGSSFRRYGYCSKAFGLVLAEAKYRGLKKVNATILNNNAPSKKIWETYGGYPSRILDENSIYEIILDDHLQDKHTCLQSRHT